MSSSSLISDAESEPETKSSNEHGKVTVDEGLQAARSTQQY